MALAILDTSATAHMPDTLEMPYRPEIVGAEEAGKLAHTYRLGGLTCLAGDVIGDYSFDHPLEVGERLVFLDMSHYTLVKTSNFNGVRLPSIALRHADDRYELVKKFGYESYRDRLG
jgi:carboxynorspermidine decarboxylase